MTPRQSKAPAAEKRTSRFSRNRSSRRRRSPRGKAVTREEGGEEPGQGHRPRLDLTGMKKKTIAELVKTPDMGVQGASGLRKQELMFKISRRRPAERLDLRRGRAGDPAGGVRLPALARLQLPAEPRRHLRLASQIKRFDLRTGDTISGQVRPPKDGERYFALLRVEAGISKARGRQAEDLFDNLTRSIR